MKLISSTVLKLVNSVLNTDKTNHKDKELSYSLDSKLNTVLKMYSPLKEEEESFEELGIRMKRNNVALDVINFAHPENVPKL